MSFHKHGKIDYAAAFPPAPLGLLGALAGASLLIDIDPLLLHKIIGALTLLFVLLLLIKKPLAGEPCPSWTRRLAAIWCSSQ
jgi:uncharacterized protein